MKQSLRLAALIASLALSACNQTEPGSADTVSGAGTGSAANVTQTNPIVAPGGAEEPGGSGAAPGNRK